ncbi:hypothetical protein [Ahrensia sp. R2A130]|uniref:hypothetical protein n=1 Tax=Ahrensia sp. R2A130 TaxID=744979 RepID=UPI0001E0A476|nr:hypothetical protein [Ahrensia sp. R2A130]EFL89664.1 conserved hypothetical protein [Ahrensia sp. R2A130]
MVRLTLAFLRVCVLLFSFAVATFAASAFLTFALFLGGDTYWLGDDVALMGSVLFTFTAWWIAVQTTFMPFAGLALLFEFTSWRSFLAHTAAGGAAALWSARMVELVQDGKVVLPYADRDVWLAVLAAGFVGGATHWLIAGHRSGMWLGPDKPDREIG